MHTAMINHPWAVSAGLTVLNKSKWKGGTLRIEAAKESFLQRCSPASTLTSLHL